MMKGSKIIRGFTLIELLIAMAVARRCSMPLAVRTSASNTSGRESVAVIARKLAA